MKACDYIKKGTEYEHQVALFMTAAVHEKKYPELKWLHSIQNEEKSGSVIMGAKARASGKKAGVSDIMLPVKRSWSGVDGSVTTYSGLYIELKKIKTKGVKPSKEQLEFGKFVSEQGYAFLVCYGWEEAWRTIVEYLNLKVQVEG
jgi:hypothetical protein